MDINENKMDLFLEAIFPLMNLKAELSALAFIPTKCELDVEGGKLNIEYEWVNKEAEEINNLLDKMMLKKHEEFFKGENIK